jgi:hypothetical protein
LSQSKNILIAKWSSIVPKFSNPDKFVQVSGQKTSLITKIKKTGYGMFTLIRCPVFSVLCPWFNQYYLAKVLFHFQICSLRPLVPPGSTALFPCDEYYL